MKIRGGTSTLQAERGIQQYNLIVIDTFLQCLKLACEQHFGTLTEDQNSKSYLVFSPCLFRRLTGTVPIRLLFSTHLIQAHMTFRINFSCVNVAHRMDALQVMDDEDEEVIFLSRSYKQRTKR